MPFHSQKSRTQENASMTDTPDTKTATLDGPFRLSRSSDGVSEWFSARDPASGVSIPAKSKADAGSMVSALNRAFSLHASFAVHAAVGAMQQDIAQREQAIRDQALEEAADIDFEGLLEKAETCTSGNRQRGNIITDAIHALQGPKTAPTNAMK